MPVVLLVFVVTAAAIAAHTAMRRVVEEGRRAEVSLLQIHSLAYRLSALEWQAIGGGGTSPRIVAEVRDVRGTMQRAVQFLERIDADAENPRLVRRAFDAYDLAIDKEFSLIAAGNLGQARVIDEELVDPAFDVLAQALATAGETYRAEGRRLERIVFLGSTLVLLLAIVIIGASAWLVQKAQTAAKIAEIEQLALTRGQADLRMFADNVPAMAVLFDEKLRCRFANKAFAAFFDHDVESILGKHLSEIVGAQSYAEIEGYFAQVLQGHPVNYQRTRSLADGELRHIEVKLLPHAGDQGEILGCFGVTTDITEHKLTEERIRRLAHHDSLTGLPNRLLFNDRLNQTISLAKRDARQFALLYLDLDDFKPVNDRFGHAAGDELLQGVAARMRHQVRASDTVARVGGDEFTVILSDIAKRADAQTVAAKIIAALGAPFQLSGKDQHVKIGASIGISVYPADGRDADALASAADTAMYQAKQTGNSFRFFEF